MELIGIIAVRAFAITTYARSNWILTTCSEQNYLCCRYYLALRNYINFLFHFTIFLPFMIYNPLGRDCKPLLET